LSPNLGFAILIGRIGSLCISLGFLRYG
jgi:hypothetical protein